MSVSLEKSPLSTIVATASIREQYLDIATDFGFINDHTMIPEALWVEAEGWLIDCGLMAESDREELEPSTIIVRVERAYEGGWETFVASSSLPLL